MSYDKASYGDVDPVGGGMHFLRDELNCDNLGVTVVECDPGWSNREHDHADDGQEEVYLLLDGEAMISVDGQEVDLSSGDAVRVDADTAREVTNGDRESTLVIVSAA